MYVMQQSALPFKVISWSTKVVDFERIFNFLLVSIVTFVVSCTVMEIRRLIGRKSPMCTYPTLIDNALARG